MRYLFTPIVSIFILSFSVTAQKPTDFLPEKPGAWSYSSNIKTPGDEVASFNKNLATLAEWLHHNVSLLCDPKGFDLDACAYGSWDDVYKLKKSSYGIRAELDFKFQLFYSDGGKWIVEPPHYEFNVNNTETGHGGILKDGLEGSPLLELFLVFPIAEELAPGVVYYDCEARTCGSIVVFNPVRPPFWIPVTVREVVKWKLENWKSDKMLYDFIKPVVDAMSEEELSAFAHYGSEDAILNVNGKGEGLQIMRFNPEYWDKTLPTSAVQFMTFAYSQPSPEDAAEHLKNNGHPSYYQDFLGQINWEKLAGMIARK